MSAAKHTPGPWVTLPEESDRAYIRIRGTRLGDRYKIANVLSLAYPGNEIVQEREAEVNRANARLIAAVPELFAACEAVIAFIEGKPDAPEPFGMVRAAIRNATGEK